MSLRRIEVECGWCGKTHTVQTLEKSLLCCSVSKGVRRLIVGVHDPETGELWFTTTKGTIVRVYTRDKKPSPKRSNAR